MKLSDSGLRLIKGFEGYHRRLPNGDCIAYKCPAGVWTLGYGCTEGIREGMVWTQEQAENALRHEIAKFEAAVMRLVTVPINQNQYDALVSFAYNCGEGALARSTLLKRLNAGDYEGAARCFAQWNKGGGRVLPGLVTRRAREASLFLKPMPGEMPEQAPTMPQQVDPPSEAPTGSRKWSLTNWLRRVFGFGAAGSIGGKAASDAGVDPMGMMSHAAGFIQAYGVQIAIFACVLGFIAAELLRLWMQQDHEEGRATASGDAP
jgi:lysozyme